MDPNLFHINWDRTLEVLVTIIILSFLIERALALVFEHRWYVSTFGEKGLKELIAFGFALGVCWVWDFDALSMIILKSETQFLGKLITAGVIAGGSKASIALFRNVLKVQSEASKVKPKPM